MALVISIIDDDNSVRTALQRMLQAHDFTASAFASAEEFLGSDERERAACLILDVRMPGMTGLALQEYLISEGCRIPTILITACPTQREQKRALAAGAASYLAKPLSEAVLLATVRDALAKSTTTGTKTSPGQAA